MPSRSPAYRYHKARNCAVVTIGGHDHYLGTYDSPASWEKYHRLVAEWFAGGRQPTAPAPVIEAKLTINELILRYIQFAKGYYVKDGALTSEVGALRHALGFLRRLYGSTPAAAFSPQCLKAVREAMIDHPITRRQKVRIPASGGVEDRTEVIRRGLCRRVINKHIQRLVRVFAWAVEEELVPASVHEALRCVKGLRKGKTRAREKPRIKPVTEGHVEAVLPLLPPTVRTMVEVQRLCGCRPQDIVQMRPVDIDASQTVWEYRPQRYKTEHLHEVDDPDLQRIVYLGPRAQELLQPLLPAEVDAFIFSPARSEAARQLARSAIRRTPRWPSHVRRRGHKTASRRARPREGYDVASYRRAIRRACLKAGIPIWHPNQLRHSRLTQIRKVYGLEASKACAGHREIAVTQHYAEQDRMVAYQVMAQTG